MILISLCPFTQTRTLKRNESLFKKLMMEALACLWDLLNPNCFLVKYSVKGS